MCDFPLSELMDEVLELTNTAEKSKR